MASSLRNLAVLALGFLGLYSTPQQALASDGVVCSDIQGESSHPESQGCIDVLSWSWGASTGVNFGGAGPPDISLPSFSGFNFVKPADTASEDLLRLLVTGSPIKGTLEYREYGPCGASCPAQAPFLRISFREVWLTSFQTGNAPGQQPTESVSIEYGQMSYCYRPVVNEALGPEQCFAWDRQTNSQITPF